MATTTTLSDDMLLEVFTELPLKPLSRLRCVSKPWRRLISTEFFRGRQPFVVSGVFFLRGDSNPKYGTLSDGGLKDYDLGLFPFYCSSDLVDCSNGLLLFVSRRAPATFYVCNIATNKWVPLPTPSRRPLLSVLVFDPCRSPHYKVICFAGWKPQGAELEVFSSLTGKWAQREVDWETDNDAMSAVMRYFDGALHVLAYPQHAVRVDLEEMTCRRTELPAPTTHDGRMGMSGGHVYFASKKGAKLRIWEMVEGCKWVLRHKIRVSSDSFNFLAFHPEMEVVYIWVPGKIVIYDMCSESWKDVCELRDEMEEAYVVQIWLFPVSRVMSECLVGLEYDE